MNIRILLVNPWIYDFAAVNLWARPLGLLKVAEYLSSYNIALSFIDCTDSYKTKKAGPHNYRNGNYGIGKYPKTIVKKPECLRPVPRRFGRYGISLNEFRTSLQDLQPFDFVFMTSIMSYWYPGVQKAIEVIKDLNKHMPVALGGIYANLWHRHASETSGADFIYKGDISENIKFALNTFGFRIKKKTSEETPYYRLGLYNTYPFAPVMTSSGCPYNCAYCSSGNLHGRFIQRDPEKVLEEITGLYEMGVRDFAFYDDALLVNSESHIKVILRKLMDSGLMMRFHCPNGLHARFIDDELAYLMKGSGFRTIRLSLETLDADRQKQSGGKVTTKDLINAVRALKRHGFTKENIGVYLMYGLPGQGLDEVKEGVEFLKGLDVRINLTEFSPVPGTESWDELVAKGIISNDMDPLLTNNTVFSYLFSGYNMKELERLKLEVKHYNMTLTEHQ